MTLVYDGNPRSTSEMGSAMKATGTFEINLNSLDSHTEGCDGIDFGHQSLSKTFTGGLEATSKGEMLSVFTPVVGSAGYVALEQVTGSLEGRQGSFVLQHFGTMNQFTDRLVLEVVPDSGTGDLAGLFGQMTFSLESDRHCYEFEYGLSYEFDLELLFQIPADAPSEETIQ